MQFVKGHAGNSQDSLLSRVTDKKAREAILVDFAKIPESDIGELQANFDVVLGIVPESP